MRILYLDAAVSYMNPTRGLLPELLARVGETTCFGPGYVSSERLRGGLRRFVRENGPFDILVASEHVALAAAGDSLVMVRYRRNYRRLDFPVADLELRPAIFSELAELDCLKAAMLLESDFYNFRESQIAAVENTFNLVISPGPQFFRPRAELPCLARESFAPRANDRWYEFQMRREERFIPLPHFVSDAEFCFTALAHRPFSWSVPGTPYDARRRARAALRAAAVDVRPQLRVGSALSMLGLHPYSWPWFLALYQEKFRREIRSSRFVFTCGSGLAVPIRKYFEIPALSAVLVCVPCSGFEALGFEHGKNCFSCDPDAVPELSAWLERNLDEAQAIAAAGQALIRERHTMQTRAAQLRNAFELALNARWAGARWCGGRMESMPLAGAARLSHAH